MDPDNENQRESSLENADKSSETDSFANSDLTEHPFSIPETSGDTNVSDLIVSAKEDDYCTSPLPNANLCLDPEPNSVVAPGNVVEASPQSCDSDGSNREISLDSADVDENLKETGDRDLVPVEGDKYKEENSKNERISSDNFVENKDFTSAVESCEDSREPEESSSSKEVGEENTIVPQINSSETENIFGAILQGKNEGAGFVKEEANIESGKIEKSDLGEDLMQKNIVSQNVETSNVDDSQEKNVVETTADICVGNSEIESSNIDDSQEKNVVEPTENICVGNSEIDNSNIDDSQEKNVEPTGDTFMDCSEIKNSNFEGGSSPERNVLAPIEGMSSKRSEIKIDFDDDSQEKNVMTSTENTSVEESVELRTGNSGENSQELFVSGLLSREVKIAEDIESSNAGSYVIDTSIFPGPPKDKDKVVIANCFEVRDCSKDVQVNPGPSDDREDISEDEFDVETLDTRQLVHGSSKNITPSSDVKFGGLSSESLVHKSDNLSVNSSDTGDIIDLKLEDATLKSLGSSCDTDDNRHSKVSNEDLEAVSDDELPIVPQVSSDTVPNQTSTNVLEDREEVSSSEDEELDRQQISNSDMLPISSGDEFTGPSQAENLESPAYNDGEREKTESLTRLESLEAEPISDEEDNVMNNDNDNDELKEASFDDGEAGEIKSPVLGSPISEQGDMMLGEMEPVSADESPDTDGELPSGDDEGRQDNNDKKFESIDSDDDDIGGDNEKLEKDKNVVSEKDKKDNDGYMETISDEENLDEDLDKKNLDTSNTEPTSVVHKESGVEKGPIPASFNEHQLELDYEETYGEDGEAKTELKEDIAKVESKVTDSGEEGEHVDEDQGLASDKDEGECSDDDCEEGEIKEPGIKKMFIKPICRFFQRGHCTWGINCRFLHPGINDKGNYQMIEIPGFKPTGIRARLGVPGQFTENQPPPEEEAELPPPPMPDVPHIETAWERGLRIAKEQRKKASERKEQEPDFEEKRLNLSVDEERELNKENERTPKIIPKDPYYDQQAYEVDEYYKIPRDPWHTGHYENFEVRYHQENSYPLPYREKPPIPPTPMRYNRPLSPPVDKFGRHREERPEPPPPERHEPLRVSDYPPPAPKHPDEWIDPWRRSKSPKQRKLRSRSRGHRNRRSVSDSSDSSRSNSRSSSGSSRSSRSGSSSGSSSRSRSPEPAPPGVDRMDRYGSDQPRSMVSVRGPENQRGGYNNRYDNRYQRGGGRPVYSNRLNDGRNMYKPRQDNNYQGGRGGMGYYGNNANNNNYRNMGGRGGGFGGVSGYNNRDPRSRDMRYIRNASPTRGGRGATPDRPLPYTRPRPKSRSSSRSSSSRSRSRSRGKSSDSSRSRSSSNSSRSSSSSSSSGGSADSEHLYRDLGSPSKNPRHPGAASSHKKRSSGDSRKDRDNSKSNHNASGSAASRHPPPPTNPDRIPHPRSPPHSRATDPKYSQIPLPPSGGGGGGGRPSDAKYASRNVPQPPVKAKDPLKVVGQKSNIKLTLLPKQQQQSGFGDRPNPLASPPHKRRMSDRDLSPTSPPPPAKRMNLPLQASSLRMAADKAKMMARQVDKAKSPPPGSLPPPPPSSSSTQRSKNATLPASPQKPAAASKLRSTMDNASTKPPPTKAVPASGSAAAPAPAGGTKSKKSMSSRREELLKQLKAVEDAIARKKFKMS